jgi:hypothetical protein
MSLPLNKLSSIPALLLGANLVWGSAAMAQDPVPGRHYPLDHRQATGIAGRWGALTKPDLQGYFQPVQITLPSAGEVVFYQGSPHNAVPVPAPARAGLAAGYTYRVKVTGMPEFPGVALYPTIELIDRLHAPSGLDEEFPIPVEISLEEVELALQDRMITKVIYLEQPDLAPPVTPEGGIRTERLSPQTNLLEAADARGRPVAILRIGGRIPDPASPIDEFHSDAPLRIQAGPIDPQVGVARP